MKTLHDWMKRRAEQLDASYTARDFGEYVFTHVPTGITRLDDAGLVEPGVLTLVAGHAGDGKSAFGLQLLEGCARHGGFDCQGYFMEDPADMVADRKLAAQLGVSAFHLRRLKLDQPAATVQERLQSAIVEGESWTKRVKVSDEKTTVDGLIKSIEKEWTPNTKLVVVDYAQAFDAEQDEKSVERVIAGLAWKLNAVAKSSGAAVVLLSQVKKEVADRGREYYKGWRFRNPAGTIDRSAVEGFRPGPGDAQWSTALWQRARQGLFLFRPGLWQRALGNSDAKDDVTEVDIAKGNFGPVGQKIRLRWDGPTATLSEIVKE
jgi:replicative DNA helicase